MRAIVMDHLGPTCRRKKNHHGPTTVGHVRTGDWFERGIGLDRRSTQWLEKRKTSPIISQNPEQL